METQAHIIEYDRTKDHDYYNEIDRERRLQKRYDKMQADNTLVETTLDLEASVKENLARKQALKDEWVSIDKLWKEVAKRRDWENAKSTLGDNPCKISVNMRIASALKRFRQRAIKKCKDMGIDYKVEYVQSLKNGKLGNYNGKELFVRRKHLSLFFNERNGYLKTSTLKHRQIEAINKYGIDNNLQEKLERNNLDYYTFLNRVNRLGWSWQKAISTPAKNTNTDRFLQMYPHRAWELKCPVKKTNKEILAEYEGKTFYRRRATLQDLLKENGITEKQFCNRIRNGWSFASATTLDVGGYTEEARKRHNKRDIAKHIKQSRAKRYR